MVKTISSRGMLLVVLLALLLTACGPPGKAACNRFEQVMAQRQEREFNSFEFRKQLKKVQEHARDAEPEIARAAANLARASDAVSELRLVVSIEAMTENCVRAGYLD